MSNAVAAAVERFLAATNPHVSIDPCLVSLLAEHSQPLRVARGDVICAGGGFRRGCFWLDSGRIKLVLLGHDGDERVLDLLVPGSSFGEAALWYDRADQLCAQALTRCDLVLLGREGICLALEQYPCFAGAMVRRIALQYLRLLEDLELSCMLSAGERVERYLLKHARRSQRLDNQGEVRLPASKSLVASSLNLSPETFSRELCQLSKRRLITIDRRVIHLHDLAELGRRVSHRSRHLRAPQHRDSAPASADHHVVAGAPEAVA